MCHTLTTGTNVPMYPCRRSTCPTLVSVRGTFCPEHGGGERRPERSAADRRYDRHERDRAAKAFYNSAGWRRARGEKLAVVFACERCGSAARHVHHRRPLASCSRELAVDQRNLEALCVPCHNAARDEDGAEP